MKKDSTYLKRLEKRRQMLDKMGDRDRVVSRPKPGPGYSRPKPGPGYSRPKPGPNRSAMKANRKRRGS